MTEFADSGGVRIAFHRDGADVGTPIVFVHGWSCDRSYFSPQAEHFAARHPVASLDLRGHGESDCPTPKAAVYSIPEFAADVSAVVTECGWERPVVVGHSMGAVVALAVAAEGRAAAAVLVDAAPLASNGPFRQFLLDGAAACEADVDGSWRTRFVNGMFLQSDRVRRQEIVSGMSGRPPDVAAACIRAMADFDGLGALSACAVPALAIGSAVPANSSQSLRDAKPDVVVGQTVGAGHFNQLEVPGQVNAMIERFLDTSLG